MTEEKEEDEYDGGRDARVKAQAYLEEKNQGCPNQRNYNVGSNGSVSVSRKVVANKEASHPEYRTRDSDSGNIVLNGVLYTVC